MILRQIRDIYVNRLQNLYVDQESISIFKIICEDLLHMTKSEIMISGEENLSHLKEGILLKSLESLTEGKPLQHITGIAHFYGHQFKVSPDTLIPRQETEELVQWILDDHKNKSVNNLLDIGTGTGCIGISLGCALNNSNPSSSSIKITLIDISEEALQIAAVNAEQIATGIPIVCMEQDILATESLEEYDIIVSNPPYVRELEKSQLHTNVIDHEPHGALFVQDNDPLVFYRKIMELASAQEKPLIYFEINQYIPEQLKTLASELGYQSEQRKDLNGNWRMMKCWK
ncbi:peptide chain release factor N(5)-glutamine methyltransferase [Nonlabens antarcticus]|uniref:peptide chain release factor N(5)-glutamine methyltransferase n=1 Tax=Nonlabens antarcticus TaxID=392714 RepID=UPI001890D0BC|nr:peptide chain release factor N(5)-glutamine methyltransferase [Nonlabens antarcticus]